MFYLYKDNATLWSPTDADKRILNPVVNLAVNSVGSMSFKILPGHNYYDTFTRMSSIISVKKANRTIFKGRVFSDKKDFRKVQTIEAEGLLGYFNDSLVAPYEFSGTVANYLSAMITQHNNQVTTKQQFKMGTAHMKTNSTLQVNTSLGDDYPTTWSELERVIINGVGGYIEIRYEDNGNYIDYYEDFYDVSTQDIQFAVNLMDLEIDKKSDGLKTAIIPLGAEDPDTGERINISSVNNNQNYIVATGDIATLCGRIYERVIFEDCTTPSDLLSKARLYLNDKIKVTNMLTVKAIDLHLVDSTVESFKKGDKVRVYSTPHNIDETGLITEYSIDCLDPANSIITIGLERQSYLEKNKNETNNRIDIVKKEIGDMVTEGIGDVVDDKIDGVKGEIISQTQTYVNEAIENSEETTRIMLREVATKTDIEELTESVSTQFTQTADEFEFRFTEVNELITTENDEIVRRIDEYDKYIKFIDGAIILGADDNPLQTRLENGRLSFVYNEVDEVAYISDNKLYITNAEILTQIKIGKFSFIPRDNGNLTFKKI